MYPKSTPDKSRQVLQIPTAGTSFKEFGRTGTQAEPSPQKNSTRMDRGVVYSKDPLHLVNQGFVLGPHRKTGASQVQGVSVLGDPPKKNIIYIYIYMPGCPFGFPSKHRPTKGVASKTDTPGPSSEARCRCRGSPWPPQRWAPTAPVAHRAVRFFRIPK